MDDEEDVKKMIDFLNCTKEENTQEYQYEEFINCEGSDAEPEELDSNIATEDLIGDEITYCDLSNTDVSKFNSYDPRNSLKPEERLIIDFCQDAELKNLLVLNRTQNMQLIQLYKKMKDLLIECQNNIRVKTKILKDHVEANKDQRNTTGAWRLGAPYFKDKQLYGAPPNADTVRKKNNNELCTYDMIITSKWSTIECEKLVRAVKLNYNISQQTQLVKAIQKAKQGGNPELLEQLESRKKELSENDNSEIPPLKSNENIDWMRVADVFLKDKHSAFECKSFWHIYLHPDIKKSTWTPSENAKLKELAKKHKFQNWDQIADALGTNRTGFIACMNYFGNLHDRFKKGEFTHLEDTRLLELVQRYKMGSYIPWTKIVQHFKKRTRAQLHYRYTYYLSQNDKRRGKFTDAEDILLMIVVDKFGRNYKKCCEYLPTRSMVQCKARYSTNLQNSIKKGSFTLKDDEIIVRYVEEHGSKTWANLTNQLHRSRGTIRQRYNTIRQFLAANPGSTVASVPRRKHKELEEDSFPFLRSIADEYRDDPVIPSLDEIEEVLRIRSHRDVSHDVLSSASEDEMETKSHVSFSSTPANDQDIDDMLTSFFCNSMKMNATKVTMIPNINRAAKGIERILDILKADLDIPNNFDEDPSLDNLDVAIINNLMENRSQKLKSGPTEDDITDLMPPNLNTVIGLRSLLIKFAHYRSEEKEVMTKFIDGGRRRQAASAVRTDIVNHFFSLPPDDREQVEIERKLFYKRFHALFKWPAIMTLESPSLELISGAKGLLMGRPQAKRTYGRTSQAPPPKRAKMSEVPCTSSKATPIRLTPVTNKSVLQDLLHNKSKKLFSFNQINCGGKTKMIIKEIPLAKHLNVAAPVEVKTTRVEEVPEVRCEAAASSSSSQDRSYFNIGHGECVIMDTDNDNESVVTGAEGSIADDEEDLKKLDMFLQAKYSDDDDDDMEDVEKLNIFLKTEANSSTSDESFG